MRPTGASGTGAGEPAARHVPPAGRSAPPGALAAGLGARWAVPVALAGGLALAAAFPPAGAWPLAAAGPALLTVALWRQSARASLVVGLAFGAAFFVPLLAWLVNLAWYVWIALAATETAVFAVAVLGLRPLLRLRAWPAAVAGWWVAAEAVRDRVPWGGFPWGRLAMSQAGAPTADWVAVGGAPLLTFLLALAGTCLAWLLLAARATWRRRAAPPPASPAPGCPAPGFPAPGAPAPGSPAPAAPAPGSPAPAAPASARPSLALPALAFAAAAGLALAGGLLPAGAPAAGGTGGGGAARDAATAIVAAVQGNVRRSRSLPVLLRASIVTANHAAVTEQLAKQVSRGGRPAPALVIWPENSTDIDPSESPPTRLTIQTAVDAIARPVLVGAVLDKPVRNAGQLWLPGRGPVATYVKRRLVPFGEVIPFRSVLSKFISLIALQPRDFTPGHRAVVFRIGKIRLGDVICYEVGFDNLVASEVAAGANLLTVQTNDAAFELDGQTGETLQQLAMARIRAVEHDRAVVVVSTTGVSAIIAPDGSVITSSRTWRPAILEARVPLRTTVTLADRAGGWPEAAISAATLAALAYALAGALRARRRRAPAAGAP